jgi:hypothetical protein
MLKRIDKGRPGWPALAGCAWLTAAFGAFAADASAPDPHALGVNESLLSYCSKAVPATAAGYKQKIRQLVQGASEETLSRVRASGAYQQARASMEDFVTRVDEHNAKRMCTNGLAARR